jgi:hypothetical protein
MRITIITDPFMCLPPDSIGAVEKECLIHQDDDINGMRVNQKVFLLNRWLRHGDVYPFQKLLIFKYGIGRIENRNIDEHTILSTGDSILLLQLVWLWSFLNR